MDELTLDLDAPERTRAFARAVGALCTGGEILLLSGDLGAGKTAFVQGLALGLGVPESQPVASPTFVLHCQYPARLELNHIDLYRLGDAARHAVPDLGFDELLGAPRAVAAVEWPEFLPAAPPDRLDVCLVVRGPTSRRATLAATGPRHARLLDAVRRLPPSVAPPSRPKAD